MMTFLSRRSSAALWKHAPVLYGRALSCSFSPAFFSPASPSRRVLPLPNRHAVASLSTTTTGTATARPVEESEMTVTERTAREAAKSLESTITITDACVNRVRELQKKHGPGSMLRVVVDSGGCSGFQYKFEVDQVVQTEDRIFEKDGIKVLIDDVSMDFLKESTVDYKKELIRSSFVVSANPNIELACGCGTSFAKKEGKVAGPPSPLSSSSSTGAPTPTSTSTTTSISTPASSPSTSRARLFSSISSTAVPRTSSPHSMRTVYVDLRVRY